MTKKLTKVTAAQSPGDVPEGMRSEPGDAKRDEVGTWLRDLQLRAGDAMGQLTCNHPKYKTFEDIHRLAASAQLASHKVTNAAAPAPKKEG